MGGCCDPGGYSDTFGDRFSRRTAKRYRKRGLDETAGRMVEYLAGKGLEGTSVLEIGGGVGHIQVELLRRGAARATNLELVDSYENEARVIAGEAGVADRMTRRQLDLATAPDAVEKHDIVVLHRVVCCYPDYERLLGAAADRATRVVVFSHPPRTRLLRAICTVENLGHRLRRSAFRTFIHDPEAMTAAASRHGLKADYRDRGATGWRIMALSL